MFVIGWKFIIMTNQNLSIFVITFNRPHFLELMINYFVNCNFMCDIYIIDGSEKKFKKQNQKIIKKFSNIENLKIRYIFSSNQLSIIHKVAKKIRTKYCLFSYDDDLPGKKFVDESLEILKKNKNYITTNGYMATAKIEFHNNFFNIFNFNVSDIKVSNIKEEEFRKRFLKFNYNEGFAYGVYRKNDFIRIFEIVGELCRIIRNPVKKIEHTTSHKLMTITFATYNLLKGNIMSSNKLMITRLNHNFNQTSGIDYYDKLGGWHINDFYKNNDYYNYFLSLKLSKIFKKVSKQTILNLIYLHIYKRMSKRLPRYFYHIHKSINSEKFSLKEKFDIFINYPEYIYFRISRNLEKLNFLNFLKFYFFNKNEIKKIKVFSKKNKINF